MALPRWSPYNIYPMQNRPEAPDVPRGVRGSNPCYFFVKAYWHKIDIKRLILSIFATADVDAIINRCTVLWNVNRRHSFGPLVASSVGQ